MSKSLRFPVFFLFASLLGAPLAHAQVAYSCAQNSLLVHEAEGVLRISVNRSGDLNTDSTGKLVIFGNAREKWYLPTGTFNLHFAPGEAQRSIEFQIENDVYDGLQTTIAECAAEFPKQGNSRMTLTVVDDEPVPTLTVAPLVEVTESDAMQRIEIPMSISPQFGHFGRVNIRVDDLTTTSADYRLEGFGEVNFSEGDRTRSIGLLILGDQIPEQDEELFLKLSGEMGDRTVRVRILDDDRPLHTLSLDRETYAFDETSPSLVTITRGGLKSSTVTATLHVRPLGTPTQWPADVPVTFAPNETTKTVELPLADGWYTGDRIGALEVLTEGFLADSAEVRVADVDPQPTLSITGGEVIEGADGATTRLEVTVALSSPLGLDLQANVTSAPGTASAEDFTRLDANIFLTPGQLSQKVPILIRGDAKAEPDETFTVSVSTCCPRLVPIANGTAIVVIRDDDTQPGIGYPALEAPAVIEVNESQKWLVATIVRGGDTSAASTATAKLFLGFGRENASVDVRFRANEKRKNVRFYIDDSYYSGHGEGRLELLAAGVSVDQRTVKIDDDETQPVVSIANLDVTEGAADQRSTFTIAIAPASSRPIEVTVQSMNGSAAGDFKNVPARITIPPFFRTFPLPVTIVGDATPEAVETFAVRIAVTPDSPAIHGNVEATCTIHDDDRARLIFVSDRIQHGATATMTLELSAPTIAAEVIHVSSLPSDVLALPSTLDFAAGARSVSFDVVGLRVGATVLRIELPSTLGSSVIDLPLLVYGAAVPVATPQEVRVPQGSAAMVSLTLLPPAGDAIRTTLASLDPAVAGTDASVVVTPGGTATFFVYGATIGRTNVSITLPAEYGGTTLLLPVEVVEAAGRQRASRH